MDLFWRGFILAWIYFGVDLFWRGFILAWIYFGVDLFWRGFILAWIYFGEDLFWWIDYFKKNRVDNSGKLIPNNL